MEWKKYSAENVLRLGESEYDYLFEITMACVRDNLVREPDHSITSDSCRLHNAECP